MERKKKTTERELAIIVACEENIFAGGFKSSINYFVL